MAWPTGWEQEQGLDIEEVLRIHKTYEDGTDVILSVRRRRDGFEVLSSAESRTSGPTDVSKGLFPSLEDARQVAVDSAANWDQHLAKFGIS